MTERPPRQRPRARRPSFMPVLWGSIALFAVLFSLLTYQFAAGSEPSRPVLLRKVVKRRIVTAVVPAPGAPSINSAPATTSSAPVVSSSGAAPVITSAS